MGCNHKIGDSVLTGTAWNLLGNILPVFAALISIPRIINQIGVERFGLLTILWSIVGYFSIFDLGLSRALTWLISSNKNSKEDELVSSRISNIINLTFVLGCLGAAILISARKVIAKNIVGGESQLFSETANSFWLISFALPLITVSSAYRGVLEGFSEFRIVNLIRIPLGVAFFVTPYLMTFLSTNLVGLAAALLITRFVGFIMHVLACKKLNILYWKPGKIDIASSISIIKYGGWLTVSNVVSPIMVYMDRILLASMLSIAEIAFYATPAEMVQRLLVFPTSLMAVLFTRFARLDKGVKHSGKDLNSLFYLILVFTLGTCFIGSMGTEWLLTHWLGTEFGTKSKNITQILLVGIYLATLAQLPFTLLQGRGFARYTAYAHCIELVLFIPIFLYFVKWWGLKGAAFAWSSRLLLDYLFLLAWSSKTECVSLKNSRKAIFISIVGAAALLSLILTNNVAIGIATLTIVTLLVTTTSSIDREAALKIFMKTNKT